MPSLHAAVQSNLKTIVRTLLCSDSPLKDYLELRDTQIFSAATSTSTTRRALQPSRYTEAHAYNT